MSTNDPEPSARLRSLYALDASPSHLETFGGDDPVAWAARCEAHDYHRPVPRHLERHHVIPRSWQAVWTGTGTEGIWAPETVLLCRSGHGNVHYWIDRMMHAVADGAATPHDALLEATAGQEEVGRQEHVIARLALERYVAAGGSLTLLTGAHLWGGIYGGQGT